MFRSSLDTLIKPILCPRKSGPTQKLTDRWQVRNEWHDRVGKMSEKKCPGECEYGSGFGIISNLDVGYSRKQPVPTEQERGNKQSGTRRREPKCL